MAVINSNDFNRLENYSFPCCPQELGVITLETYFQNLKVGAMFAYNDDSPNLIILEFVKAKNNSSILVMCEREGLTSEMEGFLPWLIAEITFENGFLVHSKLGSYFEKGDADNEFCIKQI
ncbi:hypothetical protein SC438_12410 [Legionella pneumophila]|uniref:hypothetical protein n=1 Tax=Legionella pneumophila TaxID=446 RepID=UPI001375382A|nr:hypothetical protein [Legionella pneumophila]HAT8816048.1 hypothetical protein [Legionella pneumophila subsp. pneumophila]MCZ4806397.1 hypothetical protein [Legionella pneumophila]MDW9179462.1 hypothetical protein [Legionella pneumophila]HAT1824492.1 hypothetical protein [Legionella pneumophila]HAT1865605.1 hypothetical protein [Legionella pneumophila]